MNLSAYRTPVSAKLVKSLTSVVHQTHSYTVTLVLIIVIAATILYSSHNSVLQKKQLLSFSSGAALDCKAELERDLERTQKRHRPRVAAKIASRLYDHIVMAGVRGISQLQKITVFQLGINRAKTCLERFASVNISHSRLADRRCRLANKSKHTSPFKMHFASKMRRIKSSIKQFTK